MTDELPPPSVSVERLERFRGSDIDDLCDATVLAIRDGGGFGWVDPPPRDQLERYWRGVLAVPGRHLFVGRLDCVIAGSAQLVEPPTNNEAQSFMASFTTSFVAPWARGHGIARGLVEAAEREATRLGYSVLALDVRETQLTAIRLYRTLGFTHWGTNPCYARVKGRTIQGLYFYKELRPAALEDDANR